MGFCNPFVFRLLTTRDATLVPGQARPGQARPDQTTPDQTRDQRPDQTSHIRLVHKRQPDHADQARPGQTRPDQDVTH